ncbi:hypothetical protein ABIE45_005029 [Methylobacterium sp. OAE515]
MRSEDGTRVLALEGLEPRLVGALRPVREAAGLARQERVEGGRELPGEDFRVRPFGHRQDREDPGRVMHRVTVVDRPQPFGQHAGEVEERLRMLGDHRLEGVAGQLQQMGVAQGHHGRRPRGLRQQSHLAEGLGWAQARDPGRAAVVVAGRDADCPGDEGVERVSRGALLEQDLAARHRDRDHAGPDRRGGRGIETGQERDLGRAHRCTAGDATRRSSAVGLRRIVPSPPRSRMFGPP